MALDTFDKTQPLTHRETLLAQALHDVLVKAGVVNPDISCTAEQILMVAQGYVLDDCPA